MVLPAAECCDTGPDVCCDTTYLLGDRIRTVAFDALQRCAEDMPGCSCENYTSFTTIGPQVAYPTESLIVHMVRLYQPAQTQSGGTPMIGVSAADFRVEIRHTGWPQIEADPQGGIIYVPPGEQFQVAARAAQGLSEAAYRAVLNGIQTWTLYAPAANPHVTHKQIALTEMTPLAPSGPIVGHAFTVGVKFAWRRSA